MTSFEADRPAIATAGECDHPAKRSTVASDGREQPSANSAQATAAESVFNGGACPYVLDSAPALASLLSQARAAQAGLAAQPLPIANRDTLLIQKLFGG